MSRNRVIAILLAIAVTFGVTAVWSAATIEREGDTDANVIEDSGSHAGSANEQKKGGNKVARIFAAPFKAFGKLFGHKDRVQRMTEKDAEKFESVGVMRVDDGRYPEVNNPGASGSAKEHL